MKYLLALIFTVFAGGVAMAGPLDDAACLYRASAYSPTLTQLPNEGTRTEPLTLGPTLGADAEDPQFVDDPVLGKYLDFSGSKYAISNIPASSLNGDITFAVRYRANTYWTDKLILAVIDDNGGNPLKRFMLHQSSGNKYYSRFWGDSPNNPQIAAVSTTSANTGRTDTVVVTWDSATRTHQLWLNGTLEASVTSPDDRQDAVESGLKICGPSSLTPNAKIMSLALWNSVKSQADIVALDSDSVWLNTAPPPPPLALGDLILYLDDPAHIDPIVNPLILIDGVPLTADGTEDKVIEVITQ